MADQFARVTKRILDAVVKIAMPGDRSGSGFILEDGLVLTCAHVIQGQPQIALALRDGRQVGADVLATDVRVDLAILRPSTERALAPGLALGDVSLAPGQDLIAVGHPLGLDWSVSGGHYNATRPAAAPALARIGVTLQTPLIQVDVAINAGHSGGPVVDVAGGVVGVAISIINPAVANNIGFVVPSETARRLHASVARRAKTLPALVAYSCGHHHPAGQAYCPWLGKPVEVMGRPPARKARRSLSLAPLPVFWERR